MTMKEGAEQPATVPEGDIEFQGRTLRIRLPQPEQILVWRRIMSRLESANLSDWNGKEIMDALERVRKILDSVLVNVEDIDWLDDEMLAGRVGLKGASEILLKATDAFSNRAGRRTAKKAAPARRKAPAAKKTAAKKAAAKTPKE